MITKGKFDKYGQTYDFGPEFAGLFGFRPVEINAERVFNFKIADFQKEQEILDLYLPEKY